MAETTSAPEFDTEFFAAVGRLAISWARIECGLDFAVLVIHHHQDGAAFVEPEAPWSLDRKLKYLKRAFSKFHEFHAAQDKLYALADDVRAAAEKRQDMLHGFALEHQEGAVGFRMARLLRGGAPFAAKHFSVTTDEINKWAYEANALSSRAIELGAAFAKATLDRLNQPDGKLPG